MPGLGIAADVGGVRVELGSPRHFASRGVLTGALEQRVAAAAAQGLQVVLVARDGQAVGLVTLGDELKTHARDAVAELRAAGVRHVAMLSGDHAAAADAAGQASGVDTVAAGLLPEQKVALVRDLADAHRPGRDDRRRRQRRPGARRGARRHRHGRGGDRRRRSRPRTSR